MDYTSRNKIKDLHPRWKVARLRFCFDSGVSPALTTARSSRGDNVFIQRTPVVEPLLNGFEPSCGNFTGGAVDTRFKLATNFYLKKNK